MYLEGSAEQNNAAVHELDPGFCQGTLERRWTGMGGMTELSQMSATKFADIVFEEHCSHS